MLYIQQEPMSEPDKITLRSWIQHPGFALYRRYLRSQAAEKQADAAEIMLTSDQPSDQSEIDARNKMLEAKVIIAAEKMLEQIQSKDYTFYTVIARPEPQMLPNL